MLTVGKNTKFNLKNGIKSGEYSDVPLHLALRPRAQCRRGDQTPRSGKRGPRGRRSDAGRPEEWPKEGACRVLALDRTLETGLFCSVGGRGVSQPDGTGTVLSPPAAAAAAVGLAAVVGPVAADAGPAGPLASDPLLPLSTVAPGWDGPSPWPAPRYLPAWPRANRPRKPRPMPQHLPSRTGFGWQGQGRDGGLPGSRAPCTGPNAALTPLTASPPADVSRLRSHSFVC